MTFVVGASGDYHGFLDYAGEGLEIREAPELDVAKLRDGEYALFLEFHSSEGALEDPAPTKVTLHFLSSSPDSGEALRRVRPRLDRYEDRLLEERFAGKGVDLRPERLDLPILVGPLPHSDGRTMERAYLDAIRRSDPDRDLRTATRVILDVALFAQNRDVYEADLERVYRATLAGETRPCDGHVLSLRA